MCTRNNAKGEETEDRDSTFESPSYSLFFSGRDSLVAHVRAHSMHSQREEKARERNVISCLFMPSSFSFFFEAVVQQTNIRSHFPSLTHHMRAHDKQQEGAYSGNPVWHQIA